MVSETHPSPQHVVRVLINVDVVLLGRPWCVAQAGSASDRRELRRTGYRAEDFGESASAAGVSISAMTVGSELRRHDLNLLGSVFGASCCCATLIEAIGGTRCESRVESRESGKDGNAALHFGLGGANTLAGRFARPRNWWGGVPRAASGLVELARTGPGLCSLAPTGQSNGTRDRARRSSSPGRRCRLHPHPASPGGRGVLGDQSSR